MEFLRQEYWSGLPFPSPGDHPDPGIEPMSLVSSALAGRFFTTIATCRLADFNQCVCLVTKDVVIPIGNHFHPQKCSTDMHLFHNPPSYDKILCFIYRQYLSIAPGDRGFLSC